MSLVNVRKNFQLHGFTEQQKTYFWQVVSKAYNQSNDAAALIEKFAKFVNTVDVYSAPNQFNTDIRTAHGVLINEWFNIDFNFLSTFYEIDSRGHTYKINPSVALLHEFHHYATLSKDPDASSIVNDRDLSGPTVKFENRVREDFGLDARASYFDAVSVSATPGFGKNGFTNGVMVEKVLSLGIDDKGDPILPNIDFSSARKGTSDLIISQDGQNNHYQSGAKNDFLYGYDGDDTLDGGANDDVLFGGIGDDYLIGGDGNDTLYGEWGENKVEGGTGRDTYYVISKLDLIIDHDINSKIFLEEVNWNPESDVSFKSKASGENLESRGQVFWTASKDSAVAAVSSYQIDEFKFQKTGQTIILTVNDREVREINHHVLLSSGRDYLLLDNWDTNSLEDSVVLVVDGKVSKGDKIDFSNLLLNGDEVIWDVHRDEGNSNVNSFIINTKIGEHNLNYEFYIEFSQQSRIAESIFGI
jgi:hypothetical protein